MKSALMHAALLTVALIAALGTWVAEPRDLDAEAAVVVWEHPAEQLASVHYRSGDHAVDLERRGAGEGAHLWGHEAYPSPEALMARQTGADSAAAPAADITVEEFPVADAGGPLFERLATLRAIRDLGEVDEGDRSAYGLDVTEPSLVLRFEGGAARRLVFGSAVTGGGGRYALDVDAGTAYVLPQDLLNPFEGGAGTLRVNDFQPFDDDDIETVTLEAAGGERTMRRRVVDSPPRPVWVPLDSDRHDVAFGSFVDRMDELWVTRYRPDLTAESLTRILRATYRDDAGQDIGYVEVFRGAPASDTATTASYYMRTPKTIVVGEIYPSQGERIDLDIQSLFRTGLPAPREP